MKNYLIIISLSIFLNLQLKAQNNYSTLPRAAYKSGESLTYALKYGIVTGGLATIELDQIVFEGQRLYHGRMIARTTGLADALFRVKDIYESYFNMETGLPVKAIRDIQEGNYTYYNEKRFDHVNNKVISLRSGEHEVPENILDMVSTLYHIRKIDFSKLRDGDMIYTLTFFSDEIFPFDFRFRGKETIKTPLGRFNCYKVVPIVEPGRIFNSEDDMTIWFTDDGNNIPIRIQLDMKFGTIRCDLQEYENLMYDFKKVK